MYRPPHLLLALAAAWVFAACAHAGGEIRAEAVGPAPLPSPGAPSGLLRMYTPTEPTEDQETLHYPHGDFSVLSTSGELVERVRNAEGPWDETPALVHLRPGRYLIRARTRRGGVATIPVVIESGRTTEVYLDGSFREPAGKGAYSRLPDGEAIGWAARTPSGD